MPQVVKWGAEQLVNSETTNSQNEQKVVGLEGGGYVVIWRDGSQVGTDTSGSGIKAQLFDALGTKSGSEFLVNTHIDNQQRLPDVAALAGGGLVVVWAGNAHPDETGGTEGVSGQIFNASGQKIGGEFLVNTTVANHQSNPVVAALDSGGFAVVWEHQVGGAASEDIRLQRFNAAGGKVGGETTVSTSNANSQFDPTIAALGNGRFAVVWSDDSLSADDPDASAVRLQVFNDNGTPQGGEKLVNTATTGLQHVAHLVAVGGGNFVVAWRDTSLEVAVNIATIGQLFDQNGNKVGDDFIVHDGSAQGNSPTNVSLASGPDGGFVATYSLFANPGDPASNGIQARSFRINPVTFEVTADGDQLLVNTTLTGEQEAPVLARLADGRIVVVFDDNSATAPDTSGEAVRAQIIDPRGGVVTGSNLAETIAGSFTGSAVVDDTISGLGGNDVIYGFDGIDTIIGGAGNDTIIGGADEDLAILSGNRADYSVNLLLNGHFQVKDLRAGTPDGTDDVSEVESFIFANGNFSSAAVLSDQHADFNGSATSDILWRHNDGTVGQWLLNGAANPATAQIAPAQPAAWTIKGIGDFNGDGNADILWRHDGGDIGTWHMNGAQVTSTQAFANAPNTWHIQGVADFNDDGKSDLLWRHDDGTVGTWHMNGAQVISTQAFANAPLDWHLAGTGDFNADGKDDLLWRHNDGTVGTWHMNGAQVISTQAFSNAPNAWHLQFTGDFNGDRRDDLLWRHDDGTVGLWLMDGAQVVSTFAFGNAPNTWHIEGTGDTNGDGKDDLLWRHDDGTVATWEMNGGVVSATQVFGAVANDWHIVGNHFDFI